MDKLDRNKILYILIVLVFLGVFWGWYHFKQSSEATIGISDAASLNAEGEENQTEQGQMMVRHEYRVSKCWLLSCVMSRWKKYRNAMVLSRYG